MRYYGTQMRVVKNQSETDETLNLPEEHYWAKCYIDLENIEYFHHNELETGETMTAVGFKSSEGCLNIKDSVDAFAKVVNDYANSLKGIRLN